MKTIYRQIREELNLTRAQADELLDGITAEKLERIESGKIVIPDPEDINIMADGYKKPELRNYYCSKICPIGIAKGVKAIERKDLFQIVIETLSSLNVVNEKRDMLVNIVSDGKIDDSEIEEFLKIKRELDNISATVESLQMWIEDKISTGDINKKAYDKISKDK